MAGQISSRTHSERKRAKAAFKYAQAGANLSKNTEYKAYVKKLPMLIKTNGLGAAIAFVFAKGCDRYTPKQNDPWGLIYMQIEEWLLNEEKQLVSFEKNKFVEALTEQDSTTYRAITREVIVLLIWIRRYADGLISGEATNND